MRTNCRHFQMRHSRNLLSSARIRLNRRPFPTISRPYYRQSRSIMASDADYSSFLDKANQDTGGTSKPAAPSKAATRAVNTDVPSVLRNVKVDYTSDVDEPFEPVALKWDKKSLPSEGEIQYSPQELEIWPRFMLLLTSKPQMNSAL